VGRIWKAGETVAAVEYTPRESTLKTASDMVVALGSVIVVTYTVSWNTFSWAITGIVFVTG